MFKWLKYRLELHRLEKLEGKLSSKYCEVEDRVIKLGYDDGELNHVGREIYELENWIKLYQTQYYTRICQKLVLPLPDVSNSEYYNQFNFDDNEGDRTILTPSGFQIVRNMIYEKRKRTREIYGFWVMIITGLIGALIGLVAVFKH